MWLEWSYASQGPGLKTPREPERGGSGSPRLLLLLKGMRGKKRLAGRVPMQAYWVDGSRPRGSRPSYLGLFLVDLARALWSELLPDRGGKSRAILSLEGTGFLKADAEALLQRALQARLDSVRAAAKRDGPVECLPVEVRVRTAGPAEARAWKKKAKKT